jgi:hypothetical protein
MEARKEKSDELNHFQFLIIATLLSYGFHHLIYDAA